MSQPPFPVPLEYAVASPRWKRHIGRSILLATLLAMIVIGWRWGPYLWGRSKLLYFQRQCMNFTAPPDKVVYEEEPTAAAVLLQDKRYGIYLLNHTLRNGGQSGFVKAASFIPPCWQSFEAIALKSRPLAKRAMSRRGTGGTAATIFLHERTSPAGHRRLISVSYFPETAEFQPAFIPGFDYDTQVLSPANWTQSVGETFRGYAFDVMSGYPLHPPLIRVYAGQPDPNDPAHFTIRYQMWGQEDLLDGRLLDDDQVTLKPRKLPREPRH
jgi:hypothetical protein